MPLKPHTRTAYAVLISPVMGYLCLNDSVVAMPTRAQALKILGQWREIALDNGTRRRAKIVKVEIRQLSPKKPKAKKGK